MALLTAKIKGNTLMETVVSLVIILIVFFIGTDIILNVTRSKAELQKVEFALIANEVINQTILSQHFDDEEIIRNDLFINKTCKFNNEERQELIITVEIYKENKKLFNQAKWLALEK